MNKHFKVLFYEIVVRWPNTKFGLFLRKKYYNAKLKTKFCHIGKGCEIDRIEATHIENNVALGDNVKLVISGMAKCFIGKNVAIADGVYLRSANHKFSDINIDIIYQGHTWNRVLYNNIEYGIVIEKNVWIGARAIILSGAHIGEGSVIGAGTIVSNKIIPPFSIVVGNPARIIGNRKN